MGRVAVRAAVFTLQAQETTNSTSLGPTLLAAEDRSWRLPLSIPRSLSAAHRCSSRARLHRICGGSRVTQRESGKISAVAPLVAQLLIRRLRVATTRRDRQGDEHIEMSTRWHKVMCGSPLKACSHKSNCISSVPHSSINFPNVLP